MHIKIYPSRDQRSPCKMIFYVSDYVWIFSMKNQLSTECICTIPGQSMFGITHILLKTFLLFMIWQWCSSSTFYKLDYILGLLGCAFAVARCKINRLQGSTGGEKFKLKSYFSQHIENSVYVCSTQIMALFDNNLFCKSCFLVYYVQPFCE